VDDRCCSRGARTGADSTHASSTSTAAGPGVVLPFTARRSGRDAHLGTVRGPSPSRIRRPSLFGKIELANHGTLYLADFAERDERSRTDRPVPRRQTMVLAGEGTSRWTSGSSLPARSRGGTGATENVPRRFSRRSSRGSCASRTAEHLEDVPLLLHHFLQEANQGAEETAPRIHYSALSSLETYAAGNVRELRDLVRAVAAGRSRDDDRRTISRPRSCTGICACSPA